MLQETRISMGMPVSVAIVDPSASHADIEEAFEEFSQVDHRFSPFRPDSELSRINRAELSLRDYSSDMLEILALAKETQVESNGYFNIRRPDGVIDTCGIVKGWAIRKVAQTLARKGFENFYVDAGGDVQTSGKNAAGGDWSVGIRNPFCADEIVKIVYPKSCGVATSGTYLRGSHIYNPINPDAVAADIVSLTVIGPDILEADRFATAAFAMGRDGILFVENLAGFEGYEIDMKGTARMTSGLGRYLAC